MARRSAKELSETLNGLFPDGLPEGGISLLEDIADSVQGAPEGYVPPETYRAMEERAMKAEGDYQTIRSKYINRFYSNYDEPGDQGYVMGGGVRQEQLQQQEKKVSYSDLFE